MRETVKQKEQELRTRRELAAALGVGVSTVRQWQREGCPCVFIGKRAAGQGARPRYDINEVKVWLKTRSANAAAVATDTTNGKGVEA